MSTVLAVNLPHSLTPVEAREDCERAFDLVGPHGVVLACEVDKSNDRPFERAAEHAGKRALFRRRKTQIAIPASWDDYHQHQYTLTTPIPGINPGRDFNIVFDHRTQTAYVSVHLPNGKNNRRKARWRLRGRKWNNFVRKARAIVARLHAAGWNVVIGGDINDVDGARFHPDQETLAHAGLMWIVAVPAPGYRLTHDGEEFVTRRNHGDHPIVAARNVHFTRENR